MPLFFFLGFLVFMYLFFVFWKLLLRILDAIISMYVTHKHLSLCCPSLFSKNNFFGQLDLGLGDFCFLGGKE